MQAVAAEAREAVDVRATSRINDEVFYNERGLVRGRTVRIAAVIKSLRQVIPLLLK